uniref:Uncharacterized protein n=1 Tax=uncultured marine virus TaxID=186617 RepID=A0A0F7L826_9VIRU|nr:hypothetical protein [uncultured marine virus]
MFENLSILLNCLFYSLSRLCLFILNVSHLRYAVNLCFATQLTLLLFLTHPMMNLKLSITNRAFVDIPRHYSFPVKITGVVLAFTVGGFFTRRVPSSISSKSNPFRTGTISVCSRSDFCSAIIIAPIA